MKLVCQFATLAGWWFSSTTKCGWIRTYHFDIRKINISLPHILMFTRLSGFTLKALNQIIQPLGDRTAQAPDSRQIPGGGAPLE
jgi:hypothetical protein